MNSKLPFSISKLLLPAALLSVLANSAMGGTIVLSSNTSLYTGANGGGEFMAVSATLSNSAYAPVVNISPNGLQTFCLETSEALTMGQPYFYTVETGARAGTTGDGFDEISVGSAWLMTQFAQGTLAGYNYGPGRTTSATLLQKAFWLLENEPANGGYNGAYDGSAYQALVVGYFGSLAAAQADATASQLGRVRVLNLTQNANGTGLRQSQLAYVPDNYTTLLLLGLGVAAIALQRRRLFVK